MEDFHFRILDRVAVKGRRQGGTIYELVCPVEEVSKEQLELAQMHEAALAEYIQGNLTRPQVFQQHPFPRTERCSLSNPGFPL